MRSVCAIICNFLRPSMFRISFELHVHAASAQREPPTLSDTAFPEYLCYIAASQRWICLSFWRLDRHHEFSNFAFFWTAAAYVRILHTFFQARDSGGARTSPSVREPEPGTNAGMGAG